MPTSDKPPVLSANLLHRVRTWYSEIGGPALQTIDPELATRTEPWLGAPDSRGDSDEGAVLVVGSAGIGKATLLNALLSERLILLPQGGIGPHTARSVRFRYARDPFLRVSYRGPDWFISLLKHLEDTSPLPPDVIAFARLLITGSQYSTADRGYLARMLRACLQSPSAPLPEPQCQPDAERILRVRRCLETHSTTGVFHQPAGIDLPAFLRALRDHTAGNLAPITSDATVGWDAEFLSTGLTLHLLPGVGVANDHVTRHRNISLPPSHRLLLVVDRSGLTDAVIQLIDQLGFLDHLLNPHSSIPIALLVAVVKLDLVADESRLAPNDDRESSGWFTRLEAACKQSRTLVRAQMRSVLHRKPTNVVPERTDLALCRITVQPVLPLEYRKIHLSDEDDPPRLRCPKSTHVPAILEILHHWGLEDASLQTYRVVRRLTHVAKSHPFHKTSQMALRRLQQMILSGRTK